MKQKIAQINQKHRKHVETRHEVQFYSEDSSDSDNENLIKHIEDDKTIQLYNEKEIDEIQE